MPDILVVKCNAFLPCEQMQAILDNSQAKAKAVKNTILMAEYVLQSKHGFDRAQIVEFLENMAYAADAVQEGRLNMTDINNANRQEIHLNTTSDIYQKSISSGK